MHREQQIDIINQFLQGVFGGAYAPLARVIDECIVVESWTISPTEIQQPSIVGPISVPGFTLDVSVPTYGSEIEPPGLDIVEILTTKNFYDIVRALIIAIATYRLDGILDHMAMNELAGDMSLKE